MIIRPVISELVEIGHSDFILQVEFGDLGYENHRAAVIALHVTLSPFHSANSAQGITQQSPLLFQKPPPFSVRCAIPKDGLSSQG